MKDPKVDFMTINGVHIVDEANLLSKCTTIEPKIHQYVYKQRYLNGLLTCDFTADCGTFATTSLVGSEVVVMNEESFVSDDFLADSSFASL